MSIDGSLFATKIDGQARPLDPGVHTIVVTLADGSHQTQASTVVEGMLAQRFVFDFAPKPQPRPAPPRTTSPWVFVLGGSSVATLGGFAYSGISGLGQRSDVIVCTSHCSQSDTDTARRSLVVADVFLGATVAALAGAVTVWLVTRPHTGQKARVDSAPRASAELIASPE